MSSGAREQRKAGVLFDVDGTLVDSNYLHTLAWSRALRGAGEWAPMNAIHRLIGMGGDQLLGELLGHDCPAAREARPELYRELMPEVRPFPSASELLHETARLGLAVVLATSSPRFQLEASLALLDADDAITATTDADEVSSAKPDPEIFEKAMASAGLDRARTLAVGDSVWDVLAARRAGIGCVALESGGFSEHELAEAGARAVYKDAASLLAHLADGPIGGLV